MVLSVSTENIVEKEILVTNKLDKTDKSYIQILNFLSQEPATPVNWNLFEEEKEQNC